MGNSEQRTANRVATIAGAPVPVNARHEQVTAAPQPGDAVHRSPFTVHAPRPWHREPWPWILMAGPAAVVIAGAITIWLAFSSADGLVADDYYKRGLAINKELQRHRAAAARGMTAEIDARDGLLRVHLGGRHADPEALLALVVHATRAGRDERLRLARVGPGHYQAALPPLMPGRWHVILEDPGREWRIVKEGP